MFYVKHKDVVTLFNATCQTAVLVARMKEQFDVRGTVDLLQQNADYKVAAPLFLYEKPETIYADSFLTPRGTYFLLSVSDPDEDGVRESTTQAAKNEETEKAIAFLSARFVEDKKKMQTGKKAPPKK